MALSIDKKTGKLKVPESAILRGVRDLFELHGWVVLRMQSGTVLSMDGKRHIKLNPKGMPDLVAMKPITLTHALRGSARVVYVETKTLAGQLSASQKAWRQWLINQGYGYLLARGIRDAEEWINAA